MKTIIQRICWNNRGWKMPSGSAYEGGFPSENGFAHEEWNFQLDDTCENGFIYGYVYKTPAENRIQDDDGKFRIIFYGIHPITKNKLVAGIYHEAEIVPVEDYKNLFNFFDKKGIFERRAIELTEVATQFTFKKALAEIKASVESQWLKVKCHKNKVEIFPQLLPLELFTNNQENVSHYFASFTYLDGSFNPSAKLIEIYNETHTKSSALSEDAYFRESSEKLKIIIPKHNQLSNKFCEWIRKELSVEPNQEIQQVDVRFKYKDRGVLAELKVCYGISTTKSIREALGQLLEYNHYPNRKPSDIWFIILDCEPSKDDKTFIKSLRTKLNLPIEIGWQSDNENFVFFPSKWM